MKVLKSRKVSKAFIIRNVARMHKDQYPDQVVYKKDLRVMGRVNGDFLTNLFDKEVLPEKFAILTHKGWVQCHSKPEKIGTEI